MERDWRSQLRNVKRLLDGKKDLPTHLAPIRTGNATGRAEPPKTPKSRAVRPSEQSSGPRLPETPLSGSGQTFNIGVDVGTSTTKVCVRPPGNLSSVRVVSLQDEELSGTAMSPSVLSLCDERLYFGNKAEVMAKGKQSKVFRSLKMCVACEVESPPQVPSTTCSRVCSEGERACSAMFELRGPDELVWASDLLLLFLAWVMGESRRRLPEARVGSRPPRTTYSVSVPVDQIDADSALCDVFGRLVFQAWRLSGAVIQGIAVSDALAWIDMVQSVPLPEEKERLVELCSESSAAVVGYALSPDMTKGQYAVVDIGAWTTEVAFFRFTDVARKATGKFTLAFHAARSHRVAAGQVDERCCENVRLLYRDARETNGPLPDIVREHREQALFGKQPLPLRVVGDRRDIVPRESAIRFARDVVAREIQACFRETLGKAYDKEKQESQWCGQVHVLLAGGGSIDEVLCGGAAHDNFVVDSRVVPAPGDLLGLSPDDDYRRFLIAYGLAHGRARWPHELLPSATLPIRLPQRKRPSSEELGYDEP